MASGLRLDTAVSHSSPSHKTKNIKPNIFDEILKFIFIKFWSTKMGACGFASHAHLIPNTYAVWIQK